MGLRAPLKAPLVVPGLRKAGGCHRCPSLGPVVQQHVSFELLWLYHGDDGRKPVLPGLRPLVTVGEAAATSLQQSVPQMGPRGAVGTVDGLCPDRGDCDHLSGQLWYWAVARLSPECAGTGKARHCQPCPGGHSCHACEGTAAVSHNHMGEFLERERVSGWAVPRADPEAGTAGAVHTWEVTPELWAGSGEAMEEREEREEASVENGQAIIGDDWG